MIAKAKHTHESDKVRELQILLYRSAKTNPNRKFYALFDKVQSMAVLRKAWRNVAENRGTAGVDEQTV